MKIKGIKKIKSLFEKEGVIFAYLFGSFVRGDAGKLSDIDVAVYVDEKLNSSERFKKRLKIMAELSFILKRDDVDVVVLNDAYSLLEHRILKEGELIFSRDEKKRIDYEVKAVMRYLDFKPVIERMVRETLDGSLRK